jgi:hypothetical protein
LLQACDKFVFDSQVQKRFLFKFLFVFDKVLQERNLDKGIEDVIKAIVETISKVVTVDFLQSLTEHEVKVLFFSVWNIAYEAKEM